MPDREPQKPQKSAIPARTKIRTRIELDHAQADQLTGADRALGAVDRPAADPPRRRNPKTFATPPPRHGAGRHQDDAAPHFHPPNNARTAEIRHFRGIRQRRFYIEPL